MRSNLKRQNGIGQLVLVLVLLGCGCHTSHLAGLQRTGDELLIEEVMLRDYLQRVIEPVAEIEDLHDDMPVIQTAIAIEANSVVAERLIQEFAGSSARLAIGRDTRQTHSGSIELRGSGDPAALVRVGTIRFVDGELPPGAVQLFGPVDDEVHAMATLSSYSAPLASIGFVYFLKRDGQGWRIVKRVVLYRS